MNILQDGLPVRTDLNVMYPPSVFRSDAVDLEENIPEQGEAQNDTNSSPTATETSTQGPLIVRTASYLYRAVAEFFSKVKDTISHNKITTFVFLQIFLVVLRFSRLVDEKTLFWLIFVPIFLILLVAVLHLCITAHRSSSHVQRPARQHHQHRHHHLNNLRRAHPGFDQFNERLVHQILLNSPPNRFDFFITGNGGQIRLMHLDPDLQNSINGTRMHFRLMSRGLLRFLADFIEEQQLQQGRNQRNGLTEEQIQNLPLEKYLIPLNGIDEPETCSICIDEFKQEQNLRKLPCNHRFHITCIDEWLKISNVCPNCKTDILPNMNNSNPPQEP